MMGFAVSAVSSRWDLAGSLGLESTKLLILSLMGAVTYFSFHLMMWRLTGRPSGPEKDVLTMVFAFLSRWRMALARP
jgi:hypothetical protein